MTQPNLLEFAKQGDPDAIATLMNLALQPKGVTAETQVKDECLYVFLSSARLLNQQTLVGFIRKGLANLGVKSIQAVKVYGKKAGEDTPVWTEEFEVSSLEESQTAESSTAASKQSQPSIESSNNRSGSQSDNQINGLNLSIAQLQRSAKRLAPHVQTRLNDLLIATERVTARIPVPKNLFPPTVRPSRFLAALTLVTLPAFLLGVSLAVVSYYTGGQSKGNGSVLPANASDNQNIQAEVERDMENQQAQAQKYLEAMNKAQQDFYTKNSRFASSLEELGDRPQSFPKASTTPTPSAFPIAISHS